MATNRGKTCTEPPEASEKLVSEKTAVPDSDPLVNAGSCTALNMNVKDDRHIVETDCVVPETETDFRKIVIQMLGKLNCDMSIMTKKIDTSSKKIEQVDSRLSTLEASIATNAKDMKVLKTDIGGLKDTKDAQQTQLTRLNENIERLKTRLRSLKLLMTMHPATYYGSNTKRTDLSNTP